MKRILIILSVLINSLFAYAEDQSFTNNSTQQVAPTTGLSYREIKRTYNASDYIPQDDDVYNPALMGLTSAILPGLGECFMGEAGRGSIKFMGTTLCSLSLWWFTSDKYCFNEFLGYAMTGVSVLGIAGLWLWSVSDAIKVAKVKNMYLRDLRKQYGIDLDFTPQVGFSPYDGHSPILGMSVKLSF